VKILKNKAFILTVILAVLLYGSLYFLLRYYGFNAQRIQELVASFGLSGYITIFFSQLIASFTPLPDSPIAIMSNLLYGPIIGSLIVYSAMLIAAIIQYFFALSMGQKYVSKHIPEAEYYIQKLHNGGHVFTKLVAIRVFSIVPVDLASYVAGVAGVSFRTYLFSTIVGLIPIIVNSILLSCGLYANDWVEFVLVGLVYISFVIIIWFASYLVKKYKTI